MNPLQTEEGGEKAGNVEAPSPLALLRDGGNNASQFLGSSARSLLGYGITSIRRIAE